MNQTADTVTVALTGPPLAILLLSAVLAWPVSWALLAQYKRAVQRSMRRSSHVRHEPSATTPLPPDAAHLSAGEISLHEIVAPSSDATAIALLENLKRGPARAVAAYAIGAAAYATVSTVVYVIATRIEFLPVRTLLFAFLFSWPIVVTVALVTPRGHRLRRLVPLGYVAGFATLIWITVTRSPAVTWMQGLQLWAVYNLPATLLLLPYSSRHVRAVGLLVMSFLIVALMGSYVALSLAAGSAAGVDVLASISLRIGTSAFVTLAIVALVGVAVFGFLGWHMLRWIGRRYQAKRISDESVTVDAVWLLFAFTHLIGLVFESPLWIVAIVAAFAAFKLGTRAAFRWQQRARAESNKGPVLLLLRSFSLGTESERLFDALEKYWRHAGSIQLIAGVDLATRTIEPHEFLEFTSGRLARRFIDSADTLAMRLKERDLAPDHDLRYRVNDFFCFDDTWRLVLLRLVDDADVVLMDLRGFNNHNAGCIFEIRQIVTLGALDRVVFVVDERTDMHLLEDTLRDAQAARPGGAALRVDLFRTAQKTGPDVTRLLGVLAARVAALTPA